MSESLENAPIAEVKPATKTAKKPALYRVLEPLQHDGASYLVGEEVELNEKDAAALLALEVVAVREA